MNLSLFCTWHDSCAVIACAKFHSDIIPYNGVTVKLIFHRIRIMMEKLFVKWALGYLSAAGFKWWKSMPWKCMAPQRGEFWCSSANMHCSVGGYILYWILRACPNSSPLYHNISTIILLSLLNNCWVPFQYRDHISRNGMVVRLTYLYSEKISILVIQHLYIVMDPWFLSHTPCCCNLTIKKD